MHTESVSRPESELQYDSQTNQVDIRTFDLYLFHIFLSYKVCNISVTLLVKWWTEPWPTKVTFIFQQLLLPFCLYFWTLFTFSRNGITVNFEILTWTIILPWWGVSGVFIQKKVMFIVLYFG